MNTYSFIVTLSILILIFSIKKKSDLKEDDFWKVTFYTFIISLVGAKLFHLLENLSFYLRNPNFLDLNQGYSILGAVTFGYISLNYFELKLKHSFKSLYLQLFIVLPLIQSVGRIGNIYNQELLPFSYYEIILNLLNFLVLVFINKYNQKYLIPTYFLNYGIIRIFIEYLKGSFGFLFFFSIIFFLYGFLYIFKLRLKV
jgi:prolipoprotein diacylglyceryltransferase